MIGRLFRALFRVDDRKRAIALMRRGRDLAAAGRFTEASASCAESVALCRRRARGGEGLGLLATGLSHLAWAQQHAGETQAALGSLRECVDLFRGLGRPRWRRRFATALNHLSRLLVMSGDAKDRCVADAKRRFGRT